MSRWVTIGAAVAVASVALEAALVLPFAEWAVGVVASIRGAGAAGVAIYAAAYVAAALLMLPGSLLTAGAGLLYGPWLGTAIVSPVSALAATLAFRLGRTIARDWTARRTASDPRFRAIDAAVARDGLRLVLLLRLSPVFPFNVLNYALGVTGVRLRDYVVGSFIGMLPGTFLYVYLGSLVPDVAALATGPVGGDSVRRWLSVAGLIATVAATVYITRLSRRALAAELQTSAAPTNRPGQA